MKYYALTRLDNDVMRHTEDDMIVILIQIMNHESVFFTLRIKITFICQIHLHVNRIHIQTMNRVYSQRLTCTLIYFNKDELK